MARARMVKPGFFKNETLAECPFEARLLYEGLWTIADREGRLEDKPKRIKADIFPYDNVDVDRLLGLLHDKEFIVRWTQNGDHFVAIPTFLKHQHPHPKEPKSDLPALPKKAAGRSVAKHGPANGETAARQGSEYGGTVSGPSESFPSESCTSESFPSESCTSGSSESGSSGPPSASLRSASPPQGASPLKGSRRLHRNLAASKRAVDHIRARGAK